MSHASNTLVVLTGTVLLLAACSRGTPAQGSAGSSAVHAVAPSTGTACDRKLLTIADVAGILRAPITGTKPIPGDPQSCTFTTAGIASITVMLRPGVGKATVDTWNQGRMPVAAVGMSGVGDAAAWVSSLNEVVAEKYNLLCDIQVMAIGGDLSAPIAVEQQRIGALCNKIFAAVP